MCTCIFICMHTLDQLTINSVILIKSESLKKNWMIRNRTLKILKIKLINVWLAEQSIVNCLNYLNGNLTNIFNIKAKVYAERIIIFFFYFVINVAVMCFFESQRWLVSNRWLCQGKKIYWMACTKLTSRSKGNQELFFYGMNVLYLKSNGRKN